jgi:hypothetical protein
VKGIRRIAIATAILMFGLVVVQRSAAGETADELVRFVDVGVATDYAGALEGPRGRYVDLSGATYRVRALKNGTILVRFAAESRCNGTGSSYCAVRVLVDGVEPSPVAEPGTLFDAPRSGGWQSHATQVSAQRVTRGLHTVTVQWAAFGSDAVFKLGTWHLSVESLKKPA